MELRIAIQAVFYSVFAVVGISGNIIMLIVTIKARKLHSVCNYLIFALCLADLLHLLCQIPNSLSLIAGVHFSQSSCLYVQFIPLIGAMSSTFICLSLGIDRFTAIAFPIFYRNIQLYKLKCLIAYLSPPALYSAWILGTAVATRSEENVTICSVPQALNPVAFRFATFSAFFVNVAVCIIYFISWRMIRAKSLAKSFRAIFKSIAITVMLIIFGWIATMLVNLYSFIFMEDTPERLFVQMYAGFFVNAACSANIFVYYSIKQVVYLGMKPNFILSKEYQREIRKLIGRKDSSTTNEGTQLKRSSES